LGGEAGKWAPPGGEAAAAQLPREARARGAREGQLGRHLGPKWGGGREGPVGPPRPTGPRARGKGKEIGWAAGEELARERGKGFSIYFPFFLF
jgi:hypothetical protein